MSKYCGLHQHTCYSYLDSMIRPKELVTECKKLGYPCVVATDHGHASATIKLLKECKKQDIKFVPSSEIYFVDEGGEKDRSSHHLTVIAQNNTGMENLFKILTYANQPVGSNPYGGFYYKPRVYWKGLEEHAEGLVVLTGCMSSVINKAFVAEGYQAGKRHAEHFLDFMDKEHFFVEIQNINDEKNGKIYIPEQKIILEYSRRLAKELGLDPVATSDSHWTYKTDVFNHEILKTIEARGTIDTPVADRSNNKRGRLVYNGIDYHLHSQDEMLAKFTEDEVFNSGKIAESCNVDIPLKQPHMPKFDANMTPEDVFDMLRKECLKGYKALGIHKFPNRQEYIDRMKVELKDIREAGLQDYFMIVWDVVRFCHENNIPTGKGRGSAAGSLTSYLLRITDVDPIKYRLIWERFWNRGRKGSMPDIDLDIAISRREEVIDYLRDKFGQDRVYPMITFSTLSAKAAMKDVGKALGLSFDYTNDLSKHFPHKCKSLDDAVTRNQYLADIESGVDDDIRKWKKELKKASDDGNKRGADKLRAQIAERSKTLKKMFSIARRLEDITRQRSSHACALLIADENIMGKIPLIYDPANKKVLTGFDMYDLEDMGYLKLDILGLKTLEMVSRVHPKGAMACPTFDDPEVFKLIAGGDTKGVFQLESQLGKIWCKKVKPTTIEEVSDLIALIRPAVLETGLADEYVKNKKDGFVSYHHADLEPIFKSTNGIMLYQEQMIEVAKHFAGFSLEEADKLRKATGKKLPEEMAKYKDMFIEGCVKQGYKKELGEELWGWTEKGAEYSFNKSHSMAYAMLSYTTAWMKKYYPQKFFCAMLQLSNNDQNPLDEIAELFFDAKNFNIHIKPPCFEKRNMDFEVIDKEIYFGLLHIKGVGVSSIKSMPNITCWGELYKVARSAKKNVLEALVRSGAFDYLGFSRRTIMRRCEILNAFTAKEANLFNCVYMGKQYTDKAKVKKFVKSKDFNDAVDNLKKFLNSDNITLKIVSKNRVDKLLKICEDFLTNRPNEEYSIIEKATYEMHYLGVPVTCSHVDVYNDNRKTHHVFEIKKAPNGEGIATVATVSKLTVKTDKKKNEMAFLSISDRTYMIEALVFASTYEKCSKILEEGKTYYFEGKKQRGSFIINKVEELG